MVSLNTTLWKFVPLGGQKWHKLSPWISRSKCVINIRNTDDECFKWAVIAGMYEPRIGSDKSCPLSYPKEADNFPDFSGTSKSVTFNQIKTFEKNNPHISVNVFAVKEWKVHTKTLGVKGRLVGSITSFNTGMTMFMSLTTLCKLLGECSIVRLYPRAFLHRKT